MVDACVSAFLDVNGPTDSKKTTGGGPSFYIPAKLTIVKLRFLSFFIRIALFKSKLQSAKQNIQKNLEYICSISTYFLRALCMGSRYRPHSYKPNRSH